MKFRLLLSAVAFLKASLPLPVHKFVCLILIIIVCLTVKETLTSAGIYGPRFKQPVLFGTRGCFSLCAAVVWLRRHVPTERVSVGNRQGWVGGSCAPSQCSVTSPAWPGRRVPFGDYRTNVVGQMVSRGFDLSWGVHQLFSCGKTLLESNTAELYDTQMSVIRRLVSAIFFLFGLGPLSQIHKAAGLHLVCI